MHFIILSYFHGVDGPCILDSYPEGLEEDIADDLCRTLDIPIVPGFFMQHKSNYKSSNWYFEIPSEFARGGIDVLMASIILIKEDIDPMSLKNCMKGFVDELREVNGLSRLLHPEISLNNSEETLIGIQNTREVVNVLLKEFSHTLPCGFPIIRDFKDEDLESIIEIDELILGRRRSDFWHRKIETIGKSSEVPPLIAEMGTKIVGFVLGILGEASGWEYIVPENIGWIDTIGVDPSYQNRGIATMLMKAMINSMKMAGVEMVYTLIDWREGDLLKFLNRIGFKRGNMINLELKIDDLYQKKK